MGVAIAPWERAIFGVDIDWSLVTNVEFVALLCENVLEIKLPCNICSLFPNYFGVSCHYFVQKLILSSARCNIYISRLCHDISLSVHLSVCDGSALAHYS